MNWYHITAIIILSPIILQFIYKSICQKMIRNSADPLVIKGIIDFEKASNKSFIPILDIIRKILRKESKKKTNGKKY